MLSKIQESRTTDKKECSKVKENSVQEILRFILALLFVTLKARHIQFQIHFSDVTGFLN